ncbi:hypothetical protein GNI_167760 [Gregarina niphandrodes]|uniref:WD domain, G-beta repeat protein n=1 Tax=Gregarina niphandrodes TaxID=110365 RepID=A0A023AY15_GRENI|nr:hypothetical protein GNI_167760 [Gregarina niphandrodes]EZG43544.1 hypothetical protein GNI_167760 [Gregarina niphandrodes]|eukprot:XP_011133229.1 hypothetical protein GNI_167760 [Gregarina niphandrodes]
MTVPIFRVGYTKRGRDLHRSGPVRFLPRFSVERRLGYLESCLGTVTDIVCTNKIVAVVTDLGMADFWDRITGCHLGSLADHNTEVVRSASYNRTNDTVFVLWHPRHCDKGLRIRIFNASDLARGVLQPCANVGKELQSLVIKYPGFVEFEEANLRIVTSTTDDFKYKFWDMLSYNELFSESNAAYQEIRLSKGRVSFFGLPTSSELPVRLCDITDGRLIAERKVPLLPDRPLESLELCADNLLVKQQGTPLQTFNLLSGEHTVTEGSETFDPLSMSFLRMKRQIRSLMNSASNKATPMVCAEQDKLDLYFCTGCETRKFYSITLPREVQGSRLHISSTEALAFMYVGPYVKDICLQRTQFSPEVSVTTLDCLRPAASKPGGWLGLSSKRVACALPHIVVIDLIDGGIVARYPCPNIHAVDCMAYDEFTTEILIAGGGRLVALSSGVELR